MGRRRKYHTEEEKRLANLEKATRYYHNNKVDCDRRAKERYWEKKISNRSNGSAHAESEPVTELIQQIIDTPDAK